MSSTWTVDRNAETGAWGRGVPVSGSSSWEGPPWSNRWALAELGSIDESEFVVQPRLVGHGPTLFAGPTRVDLKPVSGWSWPGRWRCGMSREVEELARPRCRSTAALRLRGCPGRRRARDHRDGCGYTWSPAAVPEDAVLDQAARDMPGCGRQAEPLAACPAGPRTPQRSTARPPSMRTMCTSSHVACLPVGFMSPKRPSSCRRPSRNWTVSVSPSEISWITVYFRSGQRRSHGRDEALAAPAIGREAGGVGALDVVLADHLVDDLDPALVGAPRAGCGGVFCLPPLTSDSLLPSSRIAWLDPHRAAAGRSRGRRGTPSPASCPNSPDPHRNRTGCQAAEPMTSVAVLQLRTPNSRPCRPSAACISSR